MGNVWSQKRNLHLLGIPSRAWKRGGVQLLFVIGVFLSFTAFICNSSRMLAELHIYKRRKSDKNPDDKKQQNLPSSMCVNSNIFAQAHYRTCNRMSFLIE